MTYPISAGVYPVETDRSFIVPSVGNSIGAIVVDAKKGPVQELTLVTNNKQFVETFGEPDNSSPTTYAALAFLEKANRLWVVRGNSSSTLASVTLDDTQGTPLTSLTVDAVNEGAWGNNVSVKVTKAEAGSELFTIEVYDTTLSTTIPVETYEVSKRFGKRDGFNKSLYCEDVINGASEYIKVTNAVSVADGTFDNYVDAEYPEVNGALVALTGGTDTAASLAEMQAGWALFSNKDEVEVSLLIQGGYDGVGSDMIALAESRTDCFAILDTSETGAGTTATSIVAARNSDGYDSSYGALYAPWIQVYDRYTDKVFYQAPSGHIAAQFAYTAASEEVWAAPAGSRRGKLNVLGTEVVFTEGERDVLYQAGVNPIQSFIGRGVEIYGQKTLTSIPSALDRVNVRMLLITIQKAMARSLTNFVFEFNDTFTRENITSILNSYLTDIRTRRGVYDFLVTCDESNNTPVVIDQNKLLVDVYVKPTRVAEFIKLNAIVTTSGATFSSAT